ncbi:MAG TPA: hypothetical protein VIX12_04595, partial [Candidatus Binataceae bacterium]
WVWFAGGGLFSIICLAWLTPLVNENWLHGSVYGFGFIDRAEVSELAASLRNASAPDEEVIAPSFACFEANRRELIRYPETYGVYRQAFYEFQRDGFFKARAHLGRTDFFELIEKTEQYWMNDIRLAVADGSVNAIILDSPIQLLPIVSLTPDFLIDHGFRPTTRTEHFIVWTRPRKTPPPSS